MNKDIIESNHRHFLLSFTHAHTYTLENLKPHIFTTWPIIILTFCVIRIETIHQPLMVHENVRTLNSNLYMVSLTS